MRQARGILGTVTVLHAVAGTAIATAVPGPLLSADDLAYLSLGRTLAGQGAAPLPAQPPYGILYPVLLAPGWILGLDGDSMLTWARLVNAVLGAALIPVLFALVRRVTGAGFGWSLTAALIGASLPALLVTGSIAWTERLLALLVAGSLLALSRLHDRPNLGRALVVAGLAVALHATHPRMLVAALVVLVAAGWLGRERPVHALAVAAVGGGGVFVAEWLRRTLAQAAFASTGSYDAGDLISTRGFDDALDMMLRAGGTLAYLVLATAGLAVVGVVMLAHDRGTGWWALAMLVGTAAVAGWFLTGVERADAHLHGRYIEVLAPVVVALGVIGLRVGRSVALITATAIGVVGAGLFGAWAGPGDNWSRPRSPVMMLGTEAGGAPFGNDFFEPGAATLVALVVGGLLVAAATQPRPWLLLGIGLAAVVGGTASSLEAVDQLFDTSTAGEVEVGLQGIDVGNVLIDAAVPADLGGAVAWEVGFEHVSAEIEPATTHVLLVPEAAGPPGAEAVVAFRAGSLWQLG